MVDDASEEVDKNILKAIQEIEKGRGQGTWTAEDLRYYLLALAWNQPNKDYCLERKLFPRSINPGKILHQTFNEMREASLVDKNSRWAIIGIAGKGEEVVISPRFIEKPDQYKGMSLDEEVKKDMQFFRMIDGLLEERGVFRELGIISTENKYKNFGLVSLARPDKYVIEILVTPNENLIGFRSRETRLNPLPGLEEMLATNTTVPELETRLNREKPESFANQHNLVLYRGRPNKPLSRFFPR